MQFYYGGQMPLRVLDEAAFWKMQESNHTAMMKIFMVDLEQEYVDSLKRWEDVLDTTHRHIQRFIESASRSDNQFPPQLYDQVLELISFCLQESIAFIQFCRQMKGNSDAIENNHTAQVMIDHIIDQSDYFIGTAQTILYERR